MENTEQVTPSRGRGTKRIIQNAVHLSELLPSDSQSMAVTPTNTQGGRGRCNIISKTLVDAMDQSDHKSFHVTLPSKQKKKGIVSMVVLPPEMRMSKVSENGKEIADTVGKISMFEPATRVKSVSSDFPKATLPQLRMSSNSVSAHEPASSQQRKEMLRNEMFHHPTDLVTNEWDDVNDIYALEREKTYLKVNEMIQYSEQ